jgi:hypothetical protein
MSGGGAESSDFQGGLRQRKQGTASAPSLAKVALISTPRISMVARLAADLLAPAATSHGQIYLHTVMAVTRVFLRGFVATTIAGFFFLRRLIVRCAT